MEVDLSTLERICDVDREAEYLKILTDEAAQGDSSQCFTLQNIAEVAGRTHQIFAPPAGRASPQSIRRRVPFDVSNRIEKSQ
jgi:hypothetical protein